MTQDTNKSPAAVEQPTGDLPPLPKSWIRNLDAAEGSRDHFAADQMQDYARAAVAAHLARQSQPSTLGCAVPEGWSVAKIDDVFQTNALRVIDPKGSAVTLRRAAPDPTETVLYRYFAAMLAAAPQTPVTQSGGAA